MLADIREPQLARREPLRFNIKGNRCRTIVAVKFDFFAVYIRFIGTVSWNRGTSGGDDRNTPDAVAAGALRRWITNERAQGGASADWLIEPVTSAT